MHLPIVNILERVEATMILPPEKRGEEKELLINNAARGFCALFANPRGGIAHELISFLVGVRHQLDALKCHAETENGDKA